MYDISLQQYRRGSLATAGWVAEFLRVFPTHERAPDALFYIGESFEQRHPIPRRRLRSSREDLSQIAARPVSALQTGSPRRATRR